MFLVGISRAWKSDELLSPSPQASVRGAAEGYQEMLVRLGPG